MQREFKHPQIFSDLLMLCQMYYPMHAALPKPFRFTVGERLLSEMAECLRLIVLANSVDKSARSGREEGAMHLRRLRASIEVIRGFFIMAWKLKLISHGALADFSSRLESVSRQASSWQQWFEQARQP